MSANAEEQPRSASAGLQSITFRRRYSSSRSDLIAEFYGPCMGVATRYDRAVGFFSSTHYLLVGGTITQFARRGGKMRIVCCPRLSATDIAAMDDGYHARIVGNSLVRELEECLQDPLGRSVSVLLATLIACKALDIRIAFRPVVARIFHDKVGVFADESGHRVSFDGSTNESWSAWAESGNGEGFHAFVDWIDPERVDDDCEYFESLWSNHEPGLEVVAFPNVAHERLEALVDPEGVDHAEQCVNDVMSSRATATPKRGRALRKHQRTVLEDWEAHSFRGIVEHATGSGKTITALTAAATALAAGYATLIVVPSATLLAQWYKSAHDYFRDSVALMLVGSGHNEWRTGANLYDFLEPGGHRIPIATLDTAATPDFTKRLHGLHPLCLIVDEVHRVGSRERRRLLQEIDADWRLGLSATWQREGDHEGTALILAYFERVLQPVYTLKDAVEDGYLCPYRYELHPLTLTEPERSSWANETARIKKAMARVHGEMSEPIRQMLIRRARIIKKAVGKPMLAGTILGEYYREGDAWLVYCDDVTQLNEVRANIESRGLQCLEYHRQGFGTEEEALAEFSRSGGIMLAIRCLDEGVDIPRIDHALILASSTTRREFIQRRGRALRRADRKYQAEFHDIIVNAQGFDDPDSATFLRSEICRAREFADSARDSMAANIVLDEWERRLPVLNGESRPGADTSAAQGFELDGED